jgi:Prenyltransferase and squalene oxidase repeat
MLQKLRNQLDRARAYATLTASAKQERHRDHQGLSECDPGIESTLSAAFEWLGHAQDRSRTADGGVARHFSLLSGWGPSYPETTGYIIPTMFDGATRYKDSMLRERARRMLDWLVSIQFPEGGFQGGTVAAPKRVPVTFNSGQILLGLVRGVREFGSVYRDPMRRAADWLVHTQDPDGAWRKHPTPFAAAGEKVYETHVAWGLFEAARIEPSAHYAEAAMANVLWALRRQRPNGWFENCCLNDPGKPLTHTIGYLLRGLVEAYRFTRDPRLLRASCKTADALVGVIRSDGYMPGRLDHDWNSCVSWTCLTGSAQITLCWLLLYVETGDIRYCDAAFAANQYIRRTVAVDGLPGVRGGVKGAFPIDGEYGKYEYLNWACKFFIDANLLELEERRKRNEFY